MSHSQYKCQLQDKESYIDNLFVIFSQSYLMNQVKEYHKEKGGRAAATSLPGGTELDPEPAGGSGDGGDAQEPLLAELPPGRIIS